MKAPFTGVTDVHVPFSKISSPGVSSVTRNVKLHTKKGRKGSAYRPLTGVKWKQA
jgi:hypothetical protein